ncbi:hypothetical protein D0863_06485 [Hortaea werneckii]|uniref:lytic cellulose monooxygenase (C4-dehydrogenating) n=1 Tax=Hortaea werneckii TaxID=91943 RepID=A0A3M7DYD9_HORWE|nr:hypothetical protein D0863_06485 [Hortaea werneckii]
MNFAALAAAHGYVDNATIGGEEYTFYQPYLDPYMDPAVRQAPIMPERVSRPIQGNGPVTDMSLIDIQCGGYTEGGEPGSSPAPISATAEAGSNVTLHWTLWPSSHFGPTMTYMARCPGDCTQYLPGKEAVWFKIAEQGQLPDGSWATDPLTQPGNAGYTYTIPECLKPGHYVVRHELFAMHAAPTQVFPGCHQLEVTGDGNTVPSELVAFPGAYTNENVEYDPSKESYAIPGPDVFTC